MTRHTERESNRGGRDAVVIDGVALDLQDPLTEFTRDADAALGHTPEDQCPSRLADQRLIQDLGHSSA